MNKLLFKTHVFDRLSTLGDAARSRILLLLEQGEFSVSELVATLQLPQSTVSRHLRVLSDDGWVVQRSSGTSRYYRVDAEMSQELRQLWGVVREQVQAAGLGEDDHERARVVLAARRQRSREFFATSAGRWDELRGSLFGAQSELLPLFGLLDPGAVVGDLGCGTAQFAASVAPFVKRVVAIDASDEMLAAAGLRATELDNVEVRPGELESLPIGDGDLDLAVLSLALVYAVDPTRVIREAGRVLGTNGRLVIVDLRVHARDDLREEMGHAWPGFSEGGIREWLIDAGFRDVVYRPLPPSVEASGPLLFLASARR